MTKSKSVRSAIWLENVCLVGIRTGRNGILMTSLLLILYLVVGSIGTFTGTVELPYLFLSLSKDPVFNILSFSIGTATMLASGSLLFLQMMNGIRGVYNQLSTIAAGIGIGCSSVIVRFTHEPALHALLNGLQWLL